MKPDDCETYDEFVQFKRQWDEQAAQFNKVVRNRFYDLRRGEKMHTTAHLFDPDATRWNRTVRTSLNAIVYGLVAGAFFSGLSTATLEGDDTLKFVCQLAIAVCGLITGHANACLMARFWRGRTD